MKLVALLIGVVVLAGVAWAARRAACSARPCASIVTMLSSADSSTAVSHPGGVRSDALW